MGEPRSLLFVTPFAPGPGAGAPLVTLGRLRALTRLGWAVDLVTRGRGAAADAGVRALCRSVHEVSGPARDARFALRAAGRLLTRGYVPKLDAAAWRAVEALHARHAHALVFLDSLYTAEHGALLRARGSGARLVLHEHNVEHRLLERQRAFAPLAKRPELALRIRRFRDLESRLARFCDACLALSDSDGEVLRALNPGFPVRVLAPDVDLARYTSARPPGDAAELLFIGSLRWAPNLDGLRWMLEHVWPRVREARPDARLLVAGHPPAGGLGPLPPGVEAAGYVDDDRAAYERARALVVPLRFGSGVRVKILNAMAMGRAVVSTRLGAEGIPLADGESVLYADEPAAFADACVRVLAQPALATSLGARAREACERHYGAAALDAQLEQALVG